MATDITAARYELQDLGTLGGLRSEVGAINNHGAIVGTATLGAEYTVPPGERSLFGHPRHAFLWQDDLLADLDDSNSIESWAHAVSDAGQVAGMLLAPGSATPYAPFGKHHAYLWENSTAHSLHSKEWIESGAWGINEAGVIAGYCRFSVETPEEPRRAVVWKRRCPQVIEMEVPPYPANNACANAVNDHAQIAGRRGPSAFLMDGREIHDIAFPNGEPCEALALNNQGAVVGFAFANEGGEHGYIWRDGRLTLIEAPGASSIHPLGIHETGLVVGCFEPTRSGSSSPNQNHGFIWRDGTFIDLNDVVRNAGGWLVETAKGMNEEGWIVGTGRLDGNAHAILLRPLK